MERGWQLVLPECEAPVEQLASRGRPSGVDWEEASYRVGCAAARQLASERLVESEAWLDAARPAGHAAEGWRERVLLNRMGELRARRLYRAVDEAQHFLLDEHVRWAPRLSATLTLMPITVDGAADLPYLEVARRSRAMTAGVISRSKRGRLLHRVAARVQAAEREAHAAWTITGQGPGACGGRAIQRLPARAAEVWVQTQREPTLRTGYEVEVLKAYQG